ncbi:hypothetical protein ACP3WW_22830, partial [Salmonella enterica]|uniref:hypothetical protein n=2 Tax=Bacteria TaxID=2 RepID=UPI003CEE07E1
HFLEENKMEQTKELQKVSETFRTTKEMTLHKKQMIEGICEFFGVTRQEMRLQLGTIVLQGNYNGQWQNITSVIIDFPMWIKNKNWTDYRLKTHVVKIK